MSAEGQYISPQRNHHEPIPGDPDPRPDPVNGYSLRRAVEMELVIRQAFAWRPEEAGRPNLHFRALNYWYVFRVRPGFLGPSIFPVLRILSRSAGYRVDQDGYRALVFAAECKLYALVYKSDVLPYKGANLNRPALAATLPLQGRAARPLRVGGRSSEVVPR